VAEEEEDHDEEDEEDEKVEGVNNAGKEIFWYASIVSTKSFTSLSRMEK